MQKVVNKGRIPCIAFPNICGLCGELWPEFFMVDDWEQTVPKQLQPEVLCRKCYEWAKKQKPAMEKPSLCIRCGKQTEFKEHNKRFSDRFVEPLEQGQPICRDCFKKIHVWVKEHHGISKNALLMEVHHFIAETAESLVSQMENATLLYPGLEFTLEEKSALMNLKLSEAAKSGLKQLLLEACSRQMFHFFSLLDDMAEPQSILNGLWYGDPPEDKTGAGGSNLFDELLEAYDLYMKHEVATGQQAITHGDT